MIEMLGVLAIIGVLSIGGLAGFKIAMNYHRANETIHDVMLRATNVPMKWDDYANFEESEFTFPDLGAYETKNAVGYTVHTYPEPLTSAYLYRVEVSDVPSEVCKRLINMNPTAVDLIKTGSDAIPSPSGDSATTSNCTIGNGNTIKMAFYFDESFRCNGSDCGSSGGGLSSSSSSSSSGGGCIEDCGSCATCEGTTCVPVEDGTGCPDEGSCINGICCGNIKTEADCAAECKLLTDVAGCPTCTEATRCTEAQVCNNGNCVCPDDAPAGADPETCECPTPALPDGVTEDGCYEWKDNNEDGCDEYVFKCGELGCKTDGSACCTEPTLPEGITNAACYDLQDTDSDGCDDTYVLRTEDPCCMDENSICCKKPTDPCCKEPQSTACLCQGLEGFAADCCRAGTCGGGLNNCPKVGEFRCDDGNCCQWAEGTCLGGGCCAWNKVCWNYEGSGYLCCDEDETCLTDKGCCHQNNICGNNCCEEGETCVSGSSCCQKDDNCLIRLSSCVCETCKDGFEPDENGVCVPTSSCRGEEYCLTSDYNEGFEEECGEWACCEDGEAYIAVYPSYEGRCCKSSEGKLIPYGDDFEICMPLNCYVPKEGTECEDFTYCCDETISDYESCSHCCRGAECPWL